VGEYTGAKDPTKDSMSADTKFILEVIPPGKSLVLDFTGGGGMLRRSVEENAAPKVFCQFKQIPRSLRQNSHQRKPPYCHLSV
jgi:hypothetical protein